MKNILKLTVLAAIALSMFSCNDKIEESWEVNTPVYMSYDDLRSSFKVAEGQEIVQSGKIYFKGRYIFVNEYQKGIHVIDNYNPSNPRIIKFIEIPGNVDMAIANDILYADSYVDLLTIDISVIEDIKIVDRDTNIFPYVIPEIESGYYGVIEEDKGVIVDYEVTTHTEELEVQNNNYRKMGLWESSFMYTDVMVANTVSSGGAKVSFGQGGSMARFTLYQNYLYAIDESSLKLINISNLENPEMEKSMEIGWGIETIFPYDDKLFFGTRTGMLIYDVTNPSVPDRISEFSHASACDPVVVDGDYAYVTLRGGNLCGAIASQLDVIDISNISNPRLLKTYPMDEPYGLGIDDSVLFVCDGHSGLKVYDATDHMKISENQLAHYADIHAFDVIPLGSVLLVIGVDGLYQYNYRDPENITELSFLPVYGE